MVKKYYSEVLDKLFDTEEECLEAEKLFKEKEDKKKKLENEKHVRERELHEAFSKFLDLEAKFFEDYGYIDLDYQSESSNKLPDNNKKSFLNFWL